MTSRSELLHSQDPYNPVFGSIPPFFGLNFQKIDKNKFISEYLEGEKMTGTSAIKSRDCRNLSTL